MFGNLATLPPPTGAYAGVAGGAGGGFGGALKSMGPAGAMDVGGMLGGTIGGLFSDMSGAYDAYQDYLNKARQTLQQHEAAGRRDITAGTREALGFGEPYRAAGAGALQAYQGTLGLGGPGTQQRAIESFQASPGYQFALHQGLQGVQRRMAAQGLGGSGAELRALQATGQGLAGQEYGQYQTRLAQLAGMGQAGAGQAAQLAYGRGGALAGLGAHYAGGIADLYRQIGATQATQLGQQAQVPGQIGATLGSLAGLAAFA